MFNLSWESYGRQDRALGDTVYEKADLVAGTSLSSQGILSVALKYDSVRCDIVWSCMEWDSSVTKQTMISPPPQYSDQFEEQDGSEAS